MSPISRSLTVVCVVALATCLALASPLDQLQQQQQQQQLKPPAVDDDLLPMGDDGSLFLAGHECGPDERLAPGAVPTCEPTCSNPRPICIKMFFAGLDYVPCFCRAPKVRDERTKLCVPIEDCPK